jgi:SAM-dependent methyltransferase
MAVTETAPLTAAGLESLLRSHSRLPASMHGNFETWLKEPGTLQRFLELVPVAGAGESTLLDVGCYQPAAGFYFSRGWRHVIGTYVDEGEATVAGCYTDASGNSATFVSSDVESDRLPVPDGSVDAVLMLQVWEHFALDPMHALWEVNRVLKPAGRLVLSTPNGAADHYAMRIMRGQAAWAGMEFTGFSHNRHNRLYDCVEMQQVLDAAGFSVTAIRSTDFAPQPFHWSSWLFRTGLRIVDGVSALWSPRPRERGATLVAMASKTAAPSQRFPEGLYLNERDWPGITAERDRMMARR